MDAGRGRQSRIGICIVPVWLTALLLTAMPESRVWSRPEKPAAASDFPDRRSAGRPDSSSAWHWTQSCSGRTEQCAGYAVSGGAGFRLGGPPQLMQLSQIHSVQGTGLCRQIIHMENNCVGNAGRTVYPGLQAPGHSTGPTAPGSARHSSGRWRAALRQPAHLDGRIQICHPSQQLFRGCLSRPSLSRPAASACIPL